MVISRYVIWSLVVIPPAIVALLFAYAPEVVIGGQVPDASLRLSLIGTGLSYYGLLFSLYAALEVRNISRRYVFKLRSPEILRKVKRISKSVSAFANEPSSELRAQSFFHEVPVIVRASKRMSTNEVSRVAKEVDAALKHLMKQGPVSSERSTAGEIDGYWDLFQKISELADEISEQIKNVRAAE